MPRQITTQPSKRLQYETDLAVAQAKLAKALKDYETWKDGPDPDEVRLAQARLENAQGCSGGG